MRTNLDFLKSFDEQSVLFPVQGDARSVLHKGLEFPTTRDEYWKYTRTSSLVEGVYPRNDIKLDSIDEYKIQGLDAHYLIFVNGRYSQELSDDVLENGVQAVSMKLADGAVKEEMLAHLDQYVDSQNQAFNAFNTSYFVDGAYIRVGRNVELEKPICIMHVSLGERQANNVRNLIVLEENAKAQIVTQYEGSQSKGSFINVVTEVKVCAGSKVSVDIIQNDGDEASQVNSTQVVQDRDSVGTISTVTKSGKLVRNNLNFSIKGEGCESNMFGVYFTHNRQHVDNHTYVDHLVPNCNSNELYKGVMADRSTGVFNGKIMVNRDAQKINAFQSNQNILLSDKASINTKPELEIYADDVKCSHGCTIGQLDDEAMFYLQSRGLGRAAAIKLLVQAFAGEVTEKIDIEAVRKNVEAFIHAKFEDLDD